MELNRWYSFAKFTRGKNMDRRVVWLRRHIICWTDWIHLLGIEPLSSYIRAYGCGCLRVYASTSNNSDTTRERERRRDLHFCSVHAAVQKNAAGGAHMNDSTDESKAKVGRWLGR